MADSCLARGHFAMQPIDTFAVRAGIAQVRSCGCSRVGLRFIARQLLLQIRSANIASPPRSSSLAEEERLRSFSMRLLAPLAEAGAG
jgi:hypothetical protein